MARLIRNVLGGGEREVPDAVAAVVVGQGRAVYADLDIEEVLAVVVDVDGDPMDVPAGDLEADIDQPFHVEREAPIPGSSNVSDLIEAVEDGTLTDEEVIVAELERADGGRKTLLAYLGVEPQQPDEPSEE